MAPRGRRRALTDKHHPARTPRQLAENHNSSQSFRCRSNPTSSTSEAGPITSAYSESGALIGSQVLNATRTDQRIGLENFINYRLAFSWPSCQRRDGRRSCGSVARPRWAEAVSIPHSIIPVHILTLSNAVTRAQVFPLGVRLQFRG